MPSASVPYQPFATQSAGGGGGSPLSVRATPNDMGAQVSQAIEEGGKEGFELAQKQQGMINETAMVGADADFATKVGKLKGDYTSLQGQAAYDAFPKYQSDVRQAFNETRSTLPAGAQHGFDQMATRSMANHIADGSSYASGQLKEQLRYNNSDLIKLSQAGILDAAVASDDTRFGEHIGTIKHATAAQIDVDHPGLKTDSETGQVSFDESKPEGVQAKADFQRNLDTNLSLAYVNRFDTLSKHDVFSAYDKYQEDRSGMPRSAQVACDAMFAPRIFAAHTQNATNSAVTHAQNEHWDMLTNPSQRDAIGTVLKNEGGLSPDGHAIYGIDKDAHPTEFAKASAMSEDDGKEYAAKFYKAEYWDKRGIASLPPSTQTIVMDGVVNHSTDFSNKLIAAAKDGASPQELVDMRRAEYQRLATANPDKYGQYLDGWNNRLDNLQVSTEGKKTYATNENGGPLTQADYYRMHSADVLARGDAYAESQMPGDLALKRSVRQTLENHMAKVISNESAQHMMDNRNIVRAINGDFTKGKVPQTEDDLRAIPGVGNLLDSVAARDPKFSETIPTIIAKVARRNDVSNSPMAYDNVLRALEPHDSEHPNAIASVDHLNRELGRSDGTGINMKDYNDIKPVIEVDNTVKETISKHMRDIAIANGNLDGKGQERAMQWYNNTIAAYKANQSKGDSKLSDADFIARIGETEGPPMPPAPSRMQQLENWATSLFKHKQQTPSGMVRVVSPDGKSGTMPVGYLDEAIKAGYKKVE